MKKAERLEAEKYLLQRIFDICSSLIFLLAQLGIGVQMPEMIEDLFFLGSCNVLVIHM